MAARIMTAFPRRLPIFIGSVSATTFIGLTLLSKQSKAPFSWIERCDGPSPASSTGRLPHGSRQSGLGLKPDAPAENSQGTRRSNAKIMRQVSAGSIAGLLGGLAVTVFSKPLAFLLGLLVLGNEILESRGIHVIPYDYLQRHLRSANIRAALRDNVAFKSSFGLTFLLASLAEL